MSEKQVAYVSSRIAKSFPENIIDVVPGKQIKIHLPNDTGFIEASSVRLQFKLQMSGRGLHKPDPKAGAHSMIRTVQLKTGNNQTQLENCDEYAAFVASQYDFSENSSKKNMRAIAEGVDKSSHADQQLFHTVGDWTGAEITTPMTHKKVQCSIPINTGFFQTGKVIPVSALEGLRMNLFTENVSRSLVLPVCGTADGVGFERGTLLKVAIANTDHSKTAVGDVFDVDLDNGTVKGVQFDIGDVLYIDLAASGTEKVLGQLVNMTEDGSGTLRLRVCPNRANGVAIGTTYAIGSKVYFKPADRKTSQALANVGTPSLSTGILSYTLSDVELVFNSVIPPKQYVDSMVKQIASSEGMQIDFRSYDLVRFNMPQGDGVQVSAINQNLTRVFTCLSLPLHSNEQDDPSLSSYQGAVDNIQSYQYRHGAMLYPSLPVQTEMLSRAVRQSDPLHLIETEKSLKNMGVSVRNLNNIWNKFFVSRAFSLYGGVSDLSQEPLALQVEYSGSTHPKLWNHYIQHLRTLTLQGNQMIVSW